MCNCQNWCRIPQQGTHDGRYPPPQHHPDCEDYILEQFARLEYDGHYCIMELDNAEDIIRDSDNPSGYKVSFVMLTRDQFDNLPEFAGF